MFVLAYNNKAGDDQVSIDSFKKYFLPRVKIENYNIEIDGRNLYDQPINDSIKQYDEIRKISTGQSDDYTTGCLLDFAYFKKHYRLIAIDLSKQTKFKDPQQISFIGKLLNTQRATIFFIIETSEETTFNFLQNSATII